MAGAYRGAGANCFVWVNTSANIFMRCCVRAGLLLEYDQADEGKTTFQEIFHSTFAYIACKKMLIIMIEMSLAFML